MMILRIVFRVFASTAKAFLLRRLFVFQCRENRMSVSAHYSPENLPAKEFAGVSIRSVISGANEDELP